MTNARKEFHPILQEEMGQMIVKLGKEIALLKLNEKKILKNQERIATELDILRRAVEASADKNKTARATSHSRN